MSRAENFIVGNYLLDIEYRAVAQEELVCPRVTRRDGVAMIYMHNRRDGTTPRSSSVMAYA